MDATLKETNIKRSIKKFFVDGLTEIPVYFDREITSAQIEKGPKKWVTIYLEGLTPRHVSEAQLFVYLFVKGDPEGDELTELRDTVFELLESGTISLYDTYKEPWEKVGGLFVVPLTPSRVAYHSDQSKMIVLNHVIRWGTVWS